MLTTPFLTDIDPREEVKGSRDPLGIQSVWTRLGRNVVSNLTTVSNSLRDFTITLLGYYFAERVAEEAGPGTELATFLKWEQLCGYARAKVLNETGFRGRDRVRERLSKRDRITLSEDRSSQILSNQKIYGLWGLYTSPARVSGLLHGDPTRLTAPARELIENVYLPQFGEYGFRDAKRIVQKLTEERGRLDVEGSDAALLKCVASFLKPKLSKGERSLYREHLVFGGKPESPAHVQPLAAALLLETSKTESFGWSPSLLRGLEKDARKHGETGAVLARHLERIRTCESLIAPSALIFSYLLCLDGRSLDEATGHLRKTLGARVSTIDPAELDALRAELGTVHTELGDRWLEIAKALSKGEYASAIELLALQNRQVMALRGAGAAWLDVRDGQLSVRFRDEQGQLPTQEELPELWRFPDFLDSLRSMAIAVEAS
jgi:hypothetical protein